MVLGTVALPFTSGFVGEFLLINSLFQYNVIVGAVAGLTVILGAVYLLRAFQHIMLGKDNVHQNNFPDLTMDEKLVLYPIVAAVFFIGIHPDPLLAISEVAASDILKIFSTFSADVR